ncbi:hypothetical protein BH20ACT23_BH20ACT23_00360 [soil metagenome]
MRTSEATSKGAQGALALSGLCFLLPFVSLSCASEELAEGVDLEQADQTLSGAQLAWGGPRREGFDPARSVGLPSPDEATELRVPPEPFAGIALVAALVGLSLVFVRVARTRLLGASAAGAVGAVSLLLLAMSPTLRGLGLSAVTLLYGFWVTIGLFGLATGVHVVQLRSGRNGSIGEQLPPAPPRAPPGPAP